MSRRKHVMSPLLRTTVNAVEKAVRTIRSTQSNLLAYKGAKAGGTYASTYTSFRNRILCYRTTFKTCFSFAKRRFSGMSLYENRLWKNGVVWIGLVLLRIGTTGRLLRTRYWTCEFHKTAGKFMSGCTTARVSGRAQLLIVRWKRNIQQSYSKFTNNKESYSSLNYRLCGLVVRVLGYRFGGPGSIPGTTRKKNVVGLERGPLSLVSTNWGATW
jgi:hypothetical protein